MRRVALAAGPPFALFIFSPANAGDPHNYAFTMERLASAKRLASAVQ